MQPRSDYDSPWKEVLDHHLPALLGLLFTDVVADIDWRQDHESLEQELRKLAPLGETGKRLADKLIRVRTLQGDDRYLHIEVQGEPEANFERRIFVYHYRGDDRFGLPVENLIILADDDPSWRPSRYVVELRRTRLTFNFMPVKLLDWVSREAELETEGNPAALFVLAHLRSRRTRTDPEQRARDKLALILKLYERKLDAEELRQWYRYLDWLLPLPSELESEVWREVIRFEEEHKMPFVTYAERHGMEKGMEKGRDLARREYLLKGIDLGLRLKFGDASAPLLASLQNVEDADLLERIFNAIETAGNLDDLRSMLPAKS